MAYGGSQARSPIGATAAGYTAASATPDPSHICNLHHSSQQCRIFNPLREAGIEPESSWTLGGFITTEPQWELPEMFLLNLISSASFRTP